MATTMDASPTTTVPRTESAPAARVKRKRGGAARRQSRAAAEKHGARASDTFSSGAYCDALFHVLERLDAARLARTPSDL